MGKKVAVVGGGIFGITAAIRLASKHKVDLFEQAEDIMTAASGINQYRAHRGYHYPRSNETISSCLRGSQQFREQYPDSLMDDVKNYYGIASENSLTGANDFIDVCDRFGLEYKIVKTKLISTKNTSLKLLVKESLIDPVLIKKSCLRQLKQSGVNLRLKTKANKKLLKDYDNVVICTYSTTNELLDDFPDSQKNYQFELCEKIVVKMPSEFGNNSVVIMDGPFMCVDPYGRSGNFLLGNVTHAIHSSNVGKYPVAEPQYTHMLNKGIIKNKKISRFDEFIVSGKRFIPNLAKAKYVGSMFTFRTVLPYKEKTDERPTLVNQLSDKVFTVFSGKFISCVDAATKLESLI